MNEIFEKEVIL
jgi:hypothetical protein